MSTRIWEDDIPGMDAGRSGAAADLVDRFLSNAAATPARTAISFNDERWSYGRLAESSAAIAGALGSRCQPGDVCGLAVARTPGMIAAMLGIMRAGCAYLPLDPALPDERLAKLVERGAPTLIIADPDAIERLPGRVAVVTLDAALGHAPIALNRPHAASGLAYVIFTSGSTGEPKGVEIGRPALANLLASLAERPGFGSDDILLAAARMSFDLSVPDFFLPLYCGGEMALHGASAGADPDALASAIVRSGATVMQATPATWRALLERGWAGSAGLRIWCGGEAMTRDLADRLLPRCAELWNMYGPTETTVWSSCGRVTPGAGPVPIGAPLRETSLHILTPALEPVARGEPGELCIGGAGLAFGYRGQPALTAARFPRSLDGARLYRTGDLAREDGHGIVWLGRNDDQVKVRGHRIELGEVEQALSRHPAVAWAAARCWADASGENALYGYVVPRGDVDPADIRTAAARSLPAYMVPKRLFMVNQMPLSLNGKVDRAALPPPADFAEPASPLPTSTEQRLAYIWRELLECGTIAAGDDFFDLGGYSLLTIRLIRRIRETFAADLAIADLLSASTLAAMAARIDASAQRPAAGVPRLTPLVTGGERPPLVWLDAGPLLRHALRGAGVDRPVLALNATTDEERWLARTDVTIAGVANVLAARLDAACPHGPLIVGGWCRWGIVALEVARLLTRSGRDVPLLIMIDAENPARRRSSLVDFTRFARARGRHAAVIPPARSLSQAVDLATFDYRPTRTTIPTALIRPTARSREAADGGWRATIERLSIYAAPGDHESMVRPPHDAALARVLREALGAARA